MQEKKLSLETNLILFSIYMFYIYIKILWKKTSSAYNINKEILKVNDSMKLIELQKARRKLKRCKLGKKKNIPATHQTLKQKQALPISQHTSEQTPLLRAIHWL